MEKGAFLLNCTYAEINVIRNILGIELVIVVFHRLHVINLMDM